MNAKEAATFLPAIAQSIEMLRDNGQRPRAILMTHEVLAVAVLSSAVAVEHLPGGRTRFAIEGVPIQPILRSPVGAPWIIVDCAQYDEWLSCNVRQFCRKVKKQ